MSSLFIQLAIAIVALPLIGGSFVLQKIGYGNSLQPIHKNSPEIQATITSNEIAQAEVKTATSPAETAKSNQEEARKAKSPETPKSSETSPAKAAETPDTPFEFNPLWRDAIVNLYCEWPGGDVSSGSGVIIDPRGIILTNAHVALDFLFYDTPKPSSLECWVRTGSPSKNKYRAKLLYIPFEYISEGVTKIGKYVPDEAIALGKNDYALLAITKVADPNAMLLASFPHLPLDAAPTPNPGSSMFMAGYPASFLGMISVMQGLSLIQTPVVVDSIGSIKGSVTPDTLVFKGSLVGQHGSSGGAVIRRGGKLTAIPSYFREKAPTTGDSVLESITVEYINRDLRIDTGFSLEEFIARDTPEGLLNTFQTEKAPLYHKLHVEAAKRASTGGTIFIVPGGY